MELTNVVKLGPYRKYFEDKTNVDCDRSYDDISLGAESLKKNKWFLSVLTISVLTRRARSFESF